MFLRFLTKTAEPIHSMAIELKKPSTDIPIPTYRQVGDPVELKDYLARQGKRLNKKVKEKPGAIPAPKKKRDNPESRMQQACVAWFRYQYNRWYNRLFAIPNGGGRTKAEAKILLGEGVVPGTPDLMLRLGKRGYLGLFLEAKIEGSSDVSPNQEIMLAECTEDGYLAIVFWTKEQFISIVNWYMSGYDTKPIGAPEMYNFN